MSVRGSRGEVPLARRNDGFHAGVAGLAAGEDYVYVLDGGNAWPDPCSRRQPAGARGPSQIVATERASSVALTLEKLVLYELHVGTFTREGTFAAAARHLSELVSLGVTAVELMPVATFPGSRGWGYDGLYAWAPHEGYGGPKGLRRFVEAAHAVGLGVVLDVVLVAQAAVLFSLLTPLLFQGGEYAERHPFQFFTDHIDPEIAEATRDGRRREFAAFESFGGHVPDPQAVETFERSVLEPAEGNTEHRRLVERLLRLRRELPRKLEVVSDDERRTLVLRRGEAVLRLDFAERTVELETQG